MSNFHRIGFGAGTALLTAALLTLSGCDQSEPPRPQSTLDAESTPAVTQSAQTRQTPPARTDSQGRPIAQVNVEDFSDNAEFVTDPNFSEVIPVEPDQIAQARRLDQSAVNQTNTRQPQAAGAPRLTFERVDHDFGKIYDVEPVSTVFAFRNTGDAPLQIQRVHASCGCTTAELSKRVFEPGEEYTLEVAFRPQGQGPSNKHVTVTSNDPNQPSIRLRISADVVPPVVMEPARLMLGTIEAGQGFDGTMTIMSRDPSMQIVEINAPEVQGLTFETAEYTGDIPEGDDYPGRKVVIARIAPNAPTGSINAKFVVRVLAAAQPGDEPRSRNVDGFITGLIRGDLITTPRFIRVTESAPGRQFESRALLTTESGRSFNVSKVEVSNSTIEDLKVDFEPAPDEGGWWIIIRGTTTARAGAFRGEVVAHTDLEEGPKPIIFNGIVRAEGLPAQGGVRSGTPTTQPRRPIN